MPPPAHASRPANTIATVLADSFLTLHYSLADRDGDEYVSTFGLSPATLQMGSGQLAETLEQCLLGMATGKRQVFQLAATKAFGTHNPRLVERINAAPCRRTSNSGSTRWWNSVRPTAPATLPVFCAN